MDRQRSAGIFDDVQFFSQYAMATRFDGDIIDGMNSSSGFVEQLPNLAFDSRTKAGEGGSVCYGKRVSVME